MALVTNQKRIFIMKFKIVTDSAADIKALDGIDFASVPLKIITDEREYVDDISLDVVDMLAGMKKYKGRSRSSCPNTQEFLSAFGDAENIFCITITSNLSGSFNAAVIAAKNYTDEHPDRHVHVIDSLSTGPENALIIEKLRELILSGKDFDTVRSEIIGYHQHTRLIFALESMNNLANNGRVSPIVAKMAGILGIRAVGRASDVGTLEMTSKNRGMQNTVSQILNDMISEGYSGGRVKIHHADNTAAAELMKSRITEKFPGAAIDVALTGGLCSFYAEQGGLLVGFEIN